MQIAVQAPDAFGVADLTIEDILSNCTRLGVTAVELAASIIEAYLGKPVMRSSLLETPNDLFETGALPLEQEILEDEIALAQQTIDERVRTWRASASLAPLGSIHDRVSTAGVRITTAWWPGLARLSDPEIDWCFGAVKMLGAHAITTPFVVGDPRRLAPFADRHGITVAFRGDGPTRPSGLEAALKHSPLHAVSVDLRACVRGGHGSPLPFLRQHAGRVAEVRIDACDLSGDPAAEIVSELLTEATANGWTLQLTIGLDSDTLGSVERFAVLGRSIDYCLNGLRLKT